MQGNKANSMGADVQPSSITELEPIVKEFVDKMKMIDNEIETLTEQKKELFEEYSEKLDLKSLKLAIRVSKIKEKVEHKDSFDVFEAVLDKIGC